MTYRQKYKTLFSLIRLLSDATLIPVIYIAAYILKFKMGWLFQHLFSLEFGQIYDHAQIEPYLSVMGIITFLWLLAFAFTGLYRQFTGVMPEINELIRVAAGVTVATIEIMALSFLIDFFPGSRSVVLYSWLIGIVVIGAARLVIHRFELKIRKRGIGLKPTLIIGADSFGQDVAEKLILFPSMGLKYCGTLCDEEPEQLHYHLRSHFKRVGHPQDYKEIFDRHEAEVVFLTDKKLKQRLTEDLILYCEDHRIELKILSDYANIMSGVVSIDDVDGLPFISYRIWRPSKIGFFLKRLFDIVAATAAVLILSPLLILIALSIKLTSADGPIFYVQERVGYRNKLFGMLKFRTMIPNAEQSTGPVMVDEKNEQRYTPIGKYLRKWSLDELPQLFNVIKGDMSIVGPRPERPFFVSQYEKTIPYFNLRHEVRGGITGWAQINGRSVLTRRPEHKVKYDLYYIRNWSMLLDIKILLKTLFVVIKGEEAY